MINIRKIVGKIVDGFYPYYCPVCEKKVKAFLPLPNYYHEQLRKQDYIYSIDDAETLNYEHYSCPYCGAVDRERLYALYIRKRFATVDHKVKFNLLEIAPSLPLGQLIEKYGVFIVRTADLLMDGVDDRIDITDMQIYVDGSFDCFICSHVLEHVSDDRKALRELYRILKPGGWGILMVPILLVLEEIDEEPGLTDEGEKWRRFGQNDHVRMYSRQGFLDRIEAAGFNVKEFGCDYFGRNVFRQCAITEMSVLYVAEKQ